MSPRIRLASWPAGLLSHAALCRFRIVRSSPMATGLQDASPFGADLVATSLLETGMCSLPALAGEADHHARDTRAFSSDQRNTLRVRYCSLRGGSAVANWRGRPGIRADEALAIRERVTNGEQIAEVAVGFDRSVRSVIRVLARSGGIAPRTGTRTGWRLSLAEREQISRGLRAGKSLRSIAPARSLRRRPSSSEVARGRRPPPLPPLAAERSRPPSPAPPTDQARRPPPPPRGGRDGSPSPAGRPSRSPAAAADHPDDPEMQVSHETIYQSLFVQGRARCAKS